MHICSIYNEKCVDLKWIQIGMVYQEKCVEFKTNTNGYGLSREMCGIKKECKYEVFLTSILAIFYNAT